MGSPLEDKYAHNRVDEFDSYVLKDYHITVAAASQNLIITRNVTAYVPPTYRPSSGARL